MGESRKDGLRVTFDGRLKLAFHGSTVTTDAAGKTDQDWGKGSTPCSSGDLPDGGGGGPTGTVLGHPGGDSAAEVAHASTGLMLVRR